MKTVSKSPLLNLSGFIDHPTNQGQTPHKIIHDTFSHTALIEKNRNQATHEMDHPFLHMLDTS
jgi:hypothetical protein